ncbi:hypothetical protein ABZ646_37600 [Streptomyces sp. NPDC007162]|uniref:hypothetical protein n=1 Tax=Streptomyces sp. NPDC007162 TaxID=3156917 RepID=UPI0033C8C2F7
MPINDPNRRDPVEILARVDSMEPGAEDVLRAFQTWVYLAGRAGWTVEEEPGFQPQSEGTDIDGVVIDGLSYRLHYGLRCRENEVDDSTIPPSLRAIFTYAAWAEPVVENSSLW